ncbi:MAG: tyrosine recombinase [Alphaproteobacteria bacterium]|jgi:integrase/recombinase XerD|nr:tyrosine recombinase [Alphaproteobacteria bacterium]
MSRGRPKSKIILPPEIVEAFLDMLTAEKGSSINTRQSYLKDLMSFDNFCSPKKIESIYEEQIKEYIHYLFSEKSLAASSVCRHISAIKQFYLFLCSTGKRKDNPSTNIEFPKAGISLPKTLSEQEINALFDLAQSRNKSYEDLRNLVFLEILYASGLRVSELISLPYTIFNREKMFINILGKGNKERIVPINKSAYNAINSYMPYRKEFLKKHGKANNKFLFPSISSKKGYISRQRIFQLIKELAVDAGIDRDKISPHIIRHAFATHLLEHGADLRAVQEILGHESIATTQIYTHTTTQHLKDVVEKHHPLSKK